MLVSPNNIDISTFKCLKDTEGLLSRLDGRWLVGHHVEAHSLGKRTALSNGDNISLLDGKGRRAVGRNVLVTLFETTVLLDVVQVIPSDNNGVLHLGRNNLSVEDASSDGNISGKGALLVDVVTLNGGIGSLDSESDITNVTHGLLALAVTNGALAGDKDGILFLVCLLKLCLY